MNDEDIVYVLNFLQGNLSPKDLERHKFGEVFTPLELVDEMLHSLPEAVWKNKHMKWLDPASGIGNFPIKALLGQSEGKFKYPGLMQGLADEIPNESARCKHIIEHMLYLIDINENNNKSSIMLLKKLCPDAVPNVSYIDKKNGFLTPKSDAVFGIKEFDVIMGNPPFNRGAVRTALVTDKTRKRKKELGLEDEQGESNFWVKFVAKAMDGYLKDGGYLLFIHPITWFKHDRLGAHEMILSRQLHELKIYKNNGPGTAFGKAGKISVAWYCLENTRPHRKTLIKYGADPDYTEELMLNTDSILILRYNSIYQKILAKSKLFGNEGVLRHKTLNHCGSGGKYKLISDIHDSGSMDYVLSSVPHADQFEPKVIIGGIHKPIVYYDKAGEIGIFAKGQRHYFVGAHLDKINDFFKTKLSTLLLNFIKFEQDFIRPNFYPDVQDFPGKITDASLAAYYGFTKKEMDIVDSMTHPIHVHTLHMHKTTAACRKTYKKRRQVKK